MRALSLSLLFAVACTGSPKSEDTSMDTAGDSETATDSETTTTTETDPPATGVISGSVVAYDGSSPVDMTVQICATVCFSIKTDGTGAFSKENLEAASYKVEAIGHGVKDHDYGNIRMHVDLEEAQQLAIPAPLYLPKVSGPKVNTGSAMDFGSVTLQAATSALKVPFGEEDNNFWAGTVDGPSIPPFWGLSNAAVAVTFLPLGTEVSDSILVSVEGEYPAGTFDVYSVDEHGAVEGPVGTAISDGAGITAAAITPSILSWLIFVPSM